MTKQLASTEQHAHSVQDIPVIGEVPKLQRVVDWVNKIAALTRPKEIRYCNGSTEEWHELIDILVKKGRATILNPEKKPNSIYVRTDPDDVARVEDQTFICSQREDDAGPLNNWIHPRDMKRIMKPLYKGSMEGRPMFVIPFCMGPLDAPDPKFGIEISDSAYVVLNMKIMTRMGQEVLDVMTERDAPFVECLHSVGLPLPEGKRDVMWPCDAEHVYISHFPERRRVWSYGSGYGGNSLLGKKCYALRIASVMARDEGWLAEHMLILRLTSPEGKQYHLCAAFPSACGKTNLAMLKPTIPGWKVETLGDDIAWMRFGPDGRLYAVNPETGFFGVAPGTAEKTNPYAIAAIEQGNSVFTNVALTDDGDIWWEGMTKQPPAHLTDWRGRSWTPEHGPEGGRHTDKAAHPNSRFTTPIRQCPILADDFDSPRGVPVDVIIFGGRRENTIPLVTESFNWQHGVFMGATCSSETTAAAVGAVGVVRRDPMAMRPFIGYHVGDYLSHWLKIGRTTSESNLPRIFYVNWFRKGSEGEFLWPGFGDNSRVLKWMVERLEGTVDAQRTPIGYVPNPEDLDVEGLDISTETLEGVTAFIPHEWADELPRIGQWFDFLGDQMPSELAEEYARIRRGVLDACERTPRPRED